MSESNGMAWGGGGDHGLGRHVKGVDNITTNISVDKKFESCLSTAVNLRKKGGEMKSNAVEVQ